MNRHFRQHDKQPASVRSGREQALVPLGSDGSSTAAAGYLLHPTRSKPNRSRNGISDLLPATTSATAGTAADHQSAAPSGSDTTASTSVPCLSHRPVVRHYVLLFLSMRMHSFRPGR